MTTKERIHQLVNELPVSEMEAIERVLTDTTSNEDDSDGPLGVWGQVISIIPRVE